MSWPWARNVRVRAAEAVTLGEAGGLAGAEAGPLGPAAELGAAALDAEAGTLAGLDADAAVELLAELQAVTSKAAQASAAQAAACRDIRAFFVVNMNFHPSLAARRAVHCCDVRRAAMVGSTVRKG
jgi:hypothetical protein